MKSKDWFSARIRLVVLIEGQGAAHYMDSVILFVAKDFESAFRSAIAIGRASETEYLNGDHQKVAWRLKEIISLDIVGPEIQDGSEVYSEPVPLEEGAQIPFDAVFKPEESRPTQTF